MDVDVAALGLFSKPWGKAMSDDDVIMEEADGWTMDDDDEDDE